MRKPTIFLSVVLLIITMTLLISGQAAAEGEPDAPHFLAYDASCEIEEVDDTTIILRGFTMSENELLDGISEVIVDFSDTTGIGQISVLYTLSPDTVDGTWVIPGLSPSADPAVVRHRGWGTGELEGLQIILRARIIAELPEGIDNPCGEEPPLVIAELIGVILPPHTES